jgi:hypothetical protein
VLLAEAVDAPTIGANCQLTGGTWYSYDDQNYTSENDLQIDHLVPLAEAWRSGASEWSDEAYARSLSYGKSPARQERAAPTALGAA